MATAGGPKIEQEGLIFGTDTGRNPSSNFKNSNVKRRHFKGAPLSNLWDNIDNTQNLRTKTDHFWDGKRWLVNSSYTHPGVGGPKGIYLGKVFKHVSGALNSSWSGNSYGYMLRDIACTNGSTFTQSAWIYASLNCDVSSIPSTIEGESGGESTVSGYSASYDLTKKGTWQRIAKKATSDGNTRFIPLYPRKNGVTDGSFNGFFMWAAPQVVLGSTPAPYIETGTSRSSTESLIDLTKTIDLDVSTVSFDSSGLPTFDGTNDYISTSISRGTLGDELTMIAYYKYTGTSTKGYTPIFGGHDGGSGTEFFIGKNSGNTSIGVQDGNYSGNFVTGTDAWDGNYHQMVYTYNNGSGKIYLDGVLKSTGTFSKCNTSELLQIGRESESGGYYFQGEIAKTAVYDSVFTAEQILADFNIHKNRFNI